MMPLLIILLLVVLLVAFWLSRAAKQTREETGMPAYTRVVSSDTSAWRKLTQPLFSRALALTGKPDYIVELDGETIPIEVKPNRVASTPYESDVMQLMAYGLLIEEAYGTLPSYGLLKYRSEIFRVEFTDELQERLLTTLDEMRADANANDVARSHNEFARCRVCGYRDECEQALE